MKEQRDRLEFEEYLNHQDIGPFGYCLTPDLPVSARTKLMGRLQLREWKKNSDNMINILNSTECTVVKIKCMGDDSINDVVVSLPIHQSQITTLEVLFLQGYQPRTRSLQDDASLGSLKWYLELRKQHGCPLETIVLDSEDNLSFQAQASAWIEEGLVGRIVAGKLFNASSALVPDWD